MHIPSLFGALLSSIGLRVVSASFLFGIGVILAKWLGPEKFGFYTLIFSVASIIGIPITAGLPSLLTRETASLVAANRVSRLKGLLVFSLGLVSFVSILGLVGYVFFVPVSAISSSLDFKYLGIIALLVPVIGLDRLRGAVMQGLGSSMLAQIPEALIRPSAYFFVLLIGYYIGSKAPLDYSLYAYVLTSFVSFFYGSYALKQMMGSRLRGVLPEYEFKKWISTLFSLGALSCSQSLVGNADILILGWLGSNYDIGVYKVALQGVALILVAQTGIGAVLSTRFSRGFADKDINRIIEISDAAVITFTCIATSAFILFLFFGKDFIRMLFGALYLEASSPLLILAIGQVVNAFSGPAMTLLIMGKHEKQALFSVLVGGVVMLIAALVLVPRFPLLGMACASSVGFAVTNIMMAALVKRVFGFDQTLIGVVKRRLR